MKKDDLPAMPFYVGDWLKAPEVRSLAPDVRGLWFDMICYMWESTERGVMVKPNGKPYSKDDIIRMVGLDNQNSGIWLTTLLDNSVCSIREDGAIYSRRMVKDQKIRLIRQKIGKKGGNPALLVNHTHNQKVNQNNEYENEYENENEDEDKNEDVVVVIDDFNQIFGTSYKYGAKNITLIKARINEGFTIEDFKRVHRKMLKAWGADEKMVKYLRPITLYSNKFESYLNMKEITHKLTETGIKAYLIGKEWLKKNEVINA